MLAEAVANVFLKTINRKTKSQSQVLKSLKLFGVNFHLEIFFAQFFSDSMSEVELNITGIFLFFQYIILI